MTQSHDADAWREIVDLDALTRWMDARGLGSGPIEKAAPIGGGTQNILLRFDRGNEAFVLRRPPRNKRAESDKVMRREMRVLGALASTDVPHPQFVAGEEDPEPLGAAFYLTRPVDGFNAAVAIPEPHRDRPEWRRAMGEALVDGSTAISPRRGAAPPTHAGSACSPASSSARSSRAAMPDLAPRAIGDRLHAQTIALFERALCRIR